MSKRYATAFSLVEISVVVLIIGILIAAITTSSKVIRKSRVATAQLLTRSSKIDQIPNMVLWYETTLPGSVIGSSDKVIPANNESVYGLKDLNPSTNVYNASQSTSGYQPLYVLNSMNGLPSVKFDGSDDYFQIANVVGYSFSSFVVLRTNSAGVGDGTGLAWTSSIVISADAPLVHLDVTPLTIGGGKPKIGTGDNDSGNAGNTSEETVLVSSISVNDDKPHIVMTTRNKDSGTRTIYVDGVSAGSSSSGPTSYSPLGQRISSSTMTIGYSVQSFDGYIGEVIIYDRVLTQDERKRVEAYLSKKWGVTIS